MNATHSPAEPKTSAAAIWSLVLGIISIVLCLGVLTGIPGIILGIVALVKIGNAPGALGGKGMAVGGIVTSAVGFLASIVAVIWFLAMGAVVTLPAAQEAREQARITKSVSQTKQILVACRHYALDNDDQIPPDLQTLVEGGYMAEDLLKSPFAPQETTEPSYELLQEGRFSTLPDGPGTTPLIRDRFSPEDKAIIGYAGGTVEVEEKPSVP